jgi:hypothetical protein
MVGSSKPDHLEREGFLSEVGGSPEADGQIELPKGLDALHGDDPTDGATEDGLDRHLTRGELGGDVHQLARPGGSLATQLAH